MTFWLVDTVIIWRNKEISWDFGLMETQELVFWLKLLKRDSEISFPVRFLEIWVKETLKETPESHFLWNLQNLRVCKVSLVYYLLLFVACRESRILPSICSFLCRSAHAHKLVCLKLSWKFWLFCDHDHH